MSIKRGVIEEIQKRAKEEKKTISLYLAELLEGKVKGKEGILSKVFKSNGLSKEDLRTVLKEEGYSKDSIAIDKGGIKELSDKDIKRIAAEMLLEIGMHIETGIAKGMKDLR